MPLQFSPLEFFLPSNNYYLLPFRFHKINNKKEIIVNEVGDFILCDIGTAGKIVNRKINIYDPVYPDLVSNFIISDSPIPNLIDVYATRYRTIKSFLDSFTALHIFVVTLRCNNKCKYCQVSRQTKDKSQYDISLEDLSNSIDIMFCSPSKNLTVEFQGGEPLLAFDKIRYAVEKISSLNEYHKKRIAYVICTNLTLIDSEILDFCKQYKILLSTSLDGPDFLHNSNRPSTLQNHFEILKENIQLCRDELGPENLSALMTTSETSLTYPKEIIDEYISQGFSSIFLRSINPYGYAKKTRENEYYHIDKFIEFYKFALNYIIELNLRGTFFVEEFASIILTKVFTPFTTGFVDLQSPNGVINSVLVYNYDGYVYPSDEARMLMEEGDPFFRLGHVSNSSYPEIIFGEKGKAISKSWANEALPGCSECGFQSYCGADPVRNYATQGDMVGHRPTNAFCKKNMEIIRYLFDLISTNNEIEKIFLSWVNRTPLSTITDSQLL